MVERYCGIPRKRPSPATDVGISICLLYTRVSPVAVAFAISPLQLFAEPISSSSRRHENFFPKISFLFVCVLIVVTLAADFRRIIFALPPPPVVFKIERVLRSKCRATREEDSLRCRTRSSMCIFNDFYSLEYEKSMHAHYICYYEKQRHGQKNFRAECDEGGY